MPDLSYDLLVIGGGATGAGVALDAALRGLRVALVEQNDFGEGTSSRSTKLVHGGVRYLEAAVKHLDKEQWNLVREGLRERKIFLHNAPHLAHPVELITPIYRWWELPYVYAGLVLYDLLSGRATLGHSRILGAKKARSINPDIDPDGLVGAVSYYDGAFNDSRMVIALLQSAQELGAEIYNHREVRGLIMEGGRIIGAKTRSRLDGSESELHARMVLNAAGPFADTIRRMEDPDLPPLMETSSGVHLVLPARFLPSPDGVLIPRTRDGRVLFALPYQGYCLAGTTDRPAPLVEHPAPTDEEIDYLIEHLNSYFDLQVRRENILSSFSGLRPLVREPGRDSTADVVREFVTELSTGGLLTIAGGKWTSYRAMAEAAVDRACETLGVRAVCRTHDYPVVGSRIPKQQILEELRKIGIAADYAEYLYAHYGDRSPEIFTAADNPKARARLHPDHPATEEELRYTIRHERVRKPLDFLVRRSNLALVDRRAAIEALPRVCAIMAEALEWSPTSASERGQEARELLEHGI
ncbi:glycerol-3-phosphate dehydrogenase/oxidase [Nitratifractor sp.]